MMFLYRKPYFLYSLCLSLVVACSAFAATKDIARALVLYDRVPVPSLSQLEQMGNCEPQLKQRPKPQTAEDRMAAMWKEIFHYSDAGVSPMQLVNLQFDHRGKERPEFTSWWYQFHSMFPDAEEFFKLYGMGSKRQYVAGTRIPPQQEQAQRRSILQRVKPWVGHPVGLPRFAKAMGGEDISDRELLELWARWVMAGTTNPIDKDYTSAELEQRFKTLIFKFHPDRNPDDDKALEAAKAITVAYGLLRHNDPTSEGR